MWRSTSVRFEGTGRCSGQRHITGLATEDQKAGICPRRLGRLPGKGVVGIRRRDPSVGGIRSREVILPFDKSRRREMSLVGCRATLVISGRARRDGRGKPRCVRSAASCSRSVLPGSARAGSLGGDGPVVTGADHPVRVRPARVSTARYPCVVGRGPVRRYRSPCCAASIVLDLNLKHHGCKTSDRRSSRSRTESGRLRKIANNLHTHRWRSGRCRTSSYRGGSVSFGKISLGVV